MLLKNIFFHILRTCLIKKESQFRSQITKSFSAPSSSSQISHFFANFFPLLDVAIWRISLARLKAQNYLKRKKIVSISLNV